MRFTATLAALRIARREVRRALGRSTLVIALVGLPVAALGFGAVTYDTFHLDAEDRAVRTLGTADAALQLLYDEPVVQPPDDLTAVPADSSSEADIKPHTERELLAVLPAGTRLHPVRTGSATVRTAHGIGGLETRGLDYEQPIADGILTPLAGRAPRTGDEVALSTAAAARISAGIGDEVELVEPKTARYRVVGLIEDPDRLAAELMVFRPAETPGAEPESTFWLADTPDPVPWSEVRRLNRTGMTVLSRAVLLDPPARSSVPYHALSGEPADDSAEVFGIGTVLVGMVALEIVLLAGPAFAISARRRQRDLALVAAAGGTPGHIRWIVLADGIVLGGLGAAAGLVVGIAAAAAAVPLLEEHVMHQRAGTLGVFPLALAGIAVLAVVTGLLAAVVPAFVAARQDVIAGLSGRRGVVRSRRRWVAVGLAVTALGAAVAMYGTTSSSEGLVLGGMVVGQLGLVICLPALIGAVGMLGGRLPLSVRVALRTTSRNRSAAAPAIAAVMAAVAAAVTIAMIQGALTERQVAQYQPSMPDGYVAVAFGEPGDTGTGEAVAAALRRTMPVTDVRVTRTGDCTTGDGVPCWVEPVLPDKLACPLSDGSQSAADYEKHAADPHCADLETWSNDMVPMPVIDNGSGLRALSGADDDDIAAATKVLRDGGAVVADKRYLVGGEVTIATLAAEKGPAPVEVSRVRVPGYVLDSGVLHRKTMVIGDGLGKRLDLETRPAAVVAATSRTPTQAEEDAGTAALHGIGGYLYVERGARMDQDPYLLILALIAGLITLGASAIATGLVLADSRRELGTLAAVGAAPRLRRLLTLAQSGVISGLGTLVGACVGVGAASVMLLALNSELAERTPFAMPYPFAVPWQVLAITVVVVPLVAMLGAGLLTRSRLPIERRPT